MDVEFVDLYTLQRDLKEGLGDLFPDSIWVKAEIAQISVKSGGHCYLELVQSEAGTVIAKVRAVIWKGRVRGIRDRRAARAFRRS